MKLLCTLVCVLVLSGSSAMARTGSVDGESLAEQFVSMSPGCGAAKTCLGMKLHVVVRGERSIQTPEWFAEQLAETNRHFSHLDVGFQLTSVDFLSERQAVISTPRQRDLLGRHVVRRGELHVFLIGHLDDIDEPGERYGVHWRDRWHRSRHWVVLAQDAPTWVLAHEIGHYFGLRHSNYADSIMNKRPRMHPPEEERSFARREFSSIKRSLKRMLRNRELHAK